MSPNNPAASESYAELETLTRPSFAKFEELRGFL
jgi:hypothetical protein